MVQPPPPNRHISLLLATPDRAADIAALHARLFDAPWDAASVTTLLEHPAAMAFVAVLPASRGPAGFIIGQFVADEAEILSLGVAPDVQRSGLGTALVEGLMRALKRAEIVRLFLEVAEDNAAARALYAKLMFREVGRRKGYYDRPDGTRADALNLSRDL